MSKMPGDEWQKFANLRLAVRLPVHAAGQVAAVHGHRAGPSDEWDHDASLDWHLESRPLNGGLMRFLADLGAVYRERSELWRGTRTSRGSAGSTPTTAISPSMPTCAETVTK